MKIAVVSDDYRTICAYFGRAIYYEVFTVTGGKITGRESLAKPSHNQFANEPHDEPGFKHGEGPAAKSRHTRMFTPILDCQVLLVGSMGQGAYDGLKQAGVQPAVTDIRDIERAVRD